MKITRKQLRSIIAEAVMLESGIPMTNAELEAHGIPTFKPGAPGYHPLFDGNYIGNGIVPRWDANSGVGDAVKAVMDNNMDNEHIAAAYPIMYSGAAPQYLPFGFFAELSKEIIKLAPDDKSIRDALEMVSFSQDYETNPPGW